MPNNKKKLLIFFLIFVTSIFIVGLFSLRFLNKNEKIAKTLPLSPVQSPSLSTHPLPDNISDQSNQKVKNLLNEDLAKLTDKPNNLNYEKIADILNEVNTLLSQSNSSQSTLKINYIQELSEAEQIVINLKEKKIQEAQKMLKNKGFLDNNVDGQDGPYTKSALQKYLDTKIVGGFNIINVSGNINNTSNTLDNPDTIENKQKNSDTSSLIPEESDKIEKSRNSSNLNDKWQLFSIVISLILFLINFLLFLVNYLRINQLSSKIDNKTSIKSDKKKQEGKTSGVQKQISQGNSTKNNNNEPLNSTYENDNRYSDKFSVNMPENNDKLEIRIVDTQQTNNSHSHSATNTNYAKQNQNNHKSTQPSKAKQTNIEKIKEESHDDGQTKIITSVTWDNYSDVRNNETKVDVILKESDEFLDFDISKNKSGYYILKPRNHEFEYEHDYEKNQSIFKYENYKKPSVGQLPVFDVKKPALVRPESGQRWTVTEKGILSFRN